VIFRRTRRIATISVVAVLLSVLSACGGGSDAKPANNTTVAGLTARDEAGSAGLADRTRTHGDDCVGDINGDGHADVLLNSHTDQWRLLYGSARGVFTPAPTPIPKGDRHGCVFADFNGDGRFDIYFAIGDCKGTCRNAKELWIQRPDHTFVNEAAQWGISDPESRGRVPIEVNANGDKRPDLFTGEEVGVNFPSANKLWINTGTKFVLQKGPPTGEIGNNCAAAADLTHNGLDDIAVCTPTKGFFLYRALGNGNYSLATTSFGLQPYGRRTVRFVDVNHDGWPDFISVTQKRVTVQLNDHGHFGKAVFSLPTDNAQDVALGDADGDGNLDVYVQMRATNADPDRIFLGDGTGHFVAGPSVPQRHGEGESATVLPGWRNGRDAFIVNNGYEETYGERQLIVVDGTRRSS
jgi:hypothetical protein